MSGLFGAIGTISGAIKLGTKIVSIFEGIWKLIKDYTDKNRRAQRKEISQQRKEIIEQIKKATTNEELDKLHRRLADLRKLS